MSATTSPRRTTAIVATTSRPRSDITAPTSGLWLPERVPHETNGVNQGRAQPVELLAQVTDERLDDVLVAFEVVVPHVIEDLGLRQHAPRVEHEVAEQVELGGGEMHGRAVAPD